MPGVCRKFRKVPLPIDPINCGQYIDIAMPVKNAATSGEMPLSAMVVATEANDLPGSTNMGHTVGIGVVDTGTV